MYNGLKKHKQFSTYLLYGIALELFKLWRLSLDRWFILWVHTWPWHMSIKFKLCGFAPNCWFLCGFYLQSSVYLYHMLGNMFPSMTTNSHSDMFPYHRKTSKKIFPSHGFLGINQHSISLWSWWKFVLILSILILFHDLVNTPRYTSSLPSYD